VANAYITPTLNSVGNTSGVLVNGIPTPNLTITDVSLTEGNSGTKIFTFTVNLSSQAPPGGVTFDIATADNTATSASNDYVQKSLTGQTISAGNSSYSFDVTVNGDISVEPNETFFVNVTNVTGANVTDGQGQGTIQNDDVVLPNLTINDVSLTEVNSGTKILSFTVNFAENAYDSIQFLLGVDSAMNTSGAQTGALDPMNDMFWTWNSGYVMLKLEGTSPQSSIVNNKVEYHIGGFSGPNSVLNYLTLHFPKDKSLLIRKGKTSTVIIDVDVDGFWNAGTAIRISGTPVCSLPGVLAKQIAANFSKLFRIKNIINEK